MTTHILKSWPPFFTAIVAGERQHELRRDDRGYAVGDVLELREYDPAALAFTGRSCAVLVTALTSAEHPCAVSDEGLATGFCIMSISQTQGGLVGDAAPHAQRGK